MDEEYTKESCKTRKTDTDQTLNTKDFEKQKNVTQIKRNTEINVDRRKMNSQKRKRETSENFRKQSHFYRKRNKYNNASQNKQNVEDMHNDSDSEICQPNYAECETTLKKRKIIKNPVAGNIKCNRKRMKREIRINKEALDVLKYQVEQMRVKMKKNRKTEKKTCHKGELHHNIDKEDNDILQSAKECIKCTKNQYNIQPGDSKQNREIEYSDYERVKETIEKERGKIENVIEDDITYEDMLTKADTLDDILTFETQLNNKNISQSIEILETESDRTIEEKKIDAMESNKKDKKQTEKDELLSDKEVLVNKRFMDNMSFQIETDDSGNSQSKQNICERKIVIKDNNSESENVRHREEGKTTENEIVNNRGSKGKDKIPSSKLQEDYNDKKRSREFCDSERDKEIEKKKKKSKRKKKKSNEQVKITEDESLQKHETNNEIVNNRGSKGKDKIPSSKLQEDYNDKKRSREFCDSERDKEIEKKKKKSKRKKKKSNEQDKITEDESLQKHETNKYQESFPTPTDESHENVLKDKLHLKSDKTL